MEYCWNLIDRDDLPAHLYAIRFGLATLLPQYLLHNVTVVDLINRLTVVQPTEPKPSMHTCLMSERIRDLVSFWVRYGVGNARHDRRSGHIVVHPFRTQKGSNPLLHLDVLLGAVGTVLRSEVAPRETVSQTQVVKFQLVCEGQRLTKPRVDMLLIVLLVEVVWDQLV